MKHVLRCTLAVLSSGLVALALVLAAPSASSVAPDDLNLTFFAGTGTAGSPAAGPARESAFNLPKDVDTDDDGNVYVTDSSNQQVERITPAGSLTIVAGSGSSGAPIPGPATTSPLSNPQALSVNGDGSFLVVSSTGHVSQVDVGGQLTVLAGGGDVPPAPGVEATDANLPYIGGVARATDGTTYLSTTDRIWSIDENGRLQVEAGIAGDLGAPVDGAVADETPIRPASIDVDAADNLYAALSSHHLVVRIDAETGVLTHVVGNGSDSGKPTDGPATETAVPYPYHVRVTDNGSLLVTNIFRVLRIEEGQLTTLAGNGQGAAPQAGPALDTGMRINGVASSGDSIYVASTDQHVLRLSTDAVPARPTASLTTDDSIVEGDPLTLTWGAATGADTLTAGGDWNGRKAVAGGSQTFEDLPAGEYTFTLRADGEGGFDTARATVTITPPPAEFTVRSAAPIVVAGRPFTVTGGGMTYFENHTVKLSGTTIGSGSSEFDGTYSTSATAPKAWRTAQRPLTVIGSQSNRLGRTSVWTVAPRPMPIKVLKPTLVKGASQKVTITQLAPAEPVRVYYRGKKILTSTADSRGTLTHYFKAGTSIGTQRITVLGLVGERRASTTFLVRR